MYLVVALLLMVLTIYLPVFTTIILTPSTGQTVTFIVWFIMIIVAYSKPSYFTLYKTHMFIISSLIYLISSNCFFLCVCVPFTHTHFLQISLLFLLFCFSFFSLHFLFLFHSSSHFSYFLPLFTFTLYQAKILGIL